MYFTQEFQQLLVRYYLGDGRLSLIHNGIIENYNVIKKALVKKGHVFQSDTIFAPLLTAEL